jgi:hypothetical protein
MQSSPTSLNNKVTSMPDAMFSNLPANKRGRRVVREVVRYSEGTPKSRRCAAEIVVAAAYKLEEKTYSLPRPARHADVLRYMMIVLGVSNLLRALLLDESCGFLTSKGRFLPRAEAYDVALAAGQIKPKAYRRLLTEDLW